MNSTVNELPFLAQELNPLNLSALGSVQVNKTAPVALTVHS